MGWWSTDDMGWICTWGGDPIIQWERLGYSEKDHLVINAVDYWMWKEALHVHNSYKFMQPTNESEMFWFHMDVQELRASSDRARKLQLSHMRPP